MLKKVKSRQIGYVMRKQKRDPKREPWRPPVDGEGGRGKARQRARRWRVGLQVM